MISSEYIQTGCDKSLGNANENKLNLLIIGTLDERKCRTCLQDIVDGEDITNIANRLIISDSSEVGIGEMIRLISSLEVSEEDGYPQNICGKCLEKLINAYTFRIQCITTDTTIKNTAFTITASTPKHIKDFNNFDSITDDIIFTSTLETTNLKDITHLTDQLNSLDRNIESSLLADSEEKSGIDGREFSLSGNKLENKICVDNRVVPHADNVRNNIYVIRSPISNKSKENIKCNFTHILNQMDENVKVSEEVLELNKNICSKQIINKIDKEKINENRVKEKIFVCDMCGLIFKTNGILKKHKLRHTEKNNFECTKCPKAFSVMDDLNKHILCHNTKSYICEMCAATFTRKDSLNTHKKIHLNIKPHSCPHCDKSFLNSYNLQNHIRTHLNEAPYICSVCKHAFKQRTALQRHMKVHQKMTTDTSKKK